MAPFKMASLKYPADPKPSAKAIHSTLRLDYGQLFSDKMLHIVKPYQEFVKLKNIKLNASVGSTFNYIGQVNKTQ